MTEMKVKATAKVPVREPQRKVIVLRGKSAKSRRKIVESLQKAYPMKYAVVRKSDLRKMIDGKPEFDNEVSEDLINTIRDQIIMSTLFHSDYATVPENIGVIVDGRHYKKSDVTTLKSLVRNVNDFLSHPAEVKVYHVNKGDEVCTGCLTKFNA